MHDPFFITTIYDRQVTGDLEKEAETLRLWEQTYPRDPVAHGLMGGYGEWMPDAVERDAANRLSGDYAGVGRALGGHTERVERPAELRAALDRCIASTESGQAALLEVMTHEEHELATG